MDFIQPNGLDTKDTGGQVGQPIIGGDDELISTKSADMTNSTTDLNQTASSENLSAKFKYPGVSQDVGSKGDNQYA